MASYEHARIARLLEALEVTPTEEQGYSSWIEAEGHLQLLRNNAKQSEIIIYACSRVVFIHAEIAKEFKTTLPDTVDLLDWDSTPYTGRAAYSWAGETRDTQVEFKDTNPRPRNLKDRQNLVFGRRMEGMDDPYNYELLQEFVHATGIHWREEQRAYCRLDGNGEIEPVVSITTPNARDGITLITCKREPLEQYLAATEGVLVRFFDLMMVKRDKFTSWAAGVRERKVETQFLFYDQCIHPDGHAFTRGAQVLPVTTSNKNLFNSITEPRSRRSGRQYTSFIAIDWRNYKTEEVTTDPKGTTNYFEAKNNSLPFEVSPAFFRAEVLAKYKADRDKYTINEAARFITCRGAWELKSYDVNEAGQVHAYICYLRNLPYQEQLHWKSHNEEPKGTISNRAYENDFEGTWSSRITALERILYTLRKWFKMRPDWWQIQDESLLLQVNTPISNSKDEWAQAFLALSKAVIEGFQTKPIRALLCKENISFSKEDRTLVLLGKLVASKVPADGLPNGLKGLRTAQQIRSKVQSHSQGTEAYNMARNALVERGTYRGHFEHICNQIANELEVIEKVLTAVPEERE